MIHCPFDALQSGYFQSAIAGAEKGDFPSLISQEFEEYK